MITAQQALELAGAVWTIVRIVGPFVIEHAPQAWDALSSLSAA